MHPTLHHHRPTLWTHTAPPSTSRRAAVDNICKVKLFKNVLNYSHNTVLYKTSK